MILVDVYIPAIDDTYDFMLDENVPIGQVVTEMVEMISKKVKEPSELHNREYILCDTDQAKVLDFTKTLYNSGVSDGSRLLLV